MSLTLTKSQKENIDKYLEKRRDECINLIMEDDEFEADREGFTNLFERLFKLEEVEIMSERESEKKKSKSRKRGDNPYITWLKTEGREYIKNNFPELKGKFIIKKAGELWGQKSVDEKSKYKCNVECTSA